VSQSGPTCSISYRPAGQRFSTKLGIDVIDDSEYDKVTAGSDCDFATFAGSKEVHPSIVWAKFKALSDGVQIASKELWGAELAVRMFFAMCAITGTLVLTGYPATAHHSMAIYETFATTIEGTVQEFKFTNPHSIILLRASGANGNGAVWYLEGDAPAMLDRDGFSKDMLRPGDRLKLSIHKLRSGQSGGLWGVREILELNGHEFSGHQCITSPDHCNPN
jgi:hypothetical protein